MIRRLILLATIPLLLNARTALARVVRVEVLTRTDLAAGASFGAAGPYERITGRIYYAFDPNNEHDKQIVDLALAPRNASGEVEAWSEFVILRPKNRAKEDAVALVDVVNRGGSVTGVFNLDAQRNLSPDSAAYYGDAFLLRRGLTIVMVGWQSDVPPGGTALHFGAPAVGDSANPITGLVRSDITIDAPTKVIPLGHRVGNSQAVAYPVANPDETTNTLTERDRPTGVRRYVPRTEWRFARVDGDSVVPDDRNVYMEQGFKAGKIYEVVYRAKNPVVVGAGLAALRDAISYLKYDSSSIAPVSYGIAFGTSQTGRLLRHFLYQGFNDDERGRKAFDGFFAHTAGAGRGSFNHRFAQPSRDAQPYSTFFYPTDVFPFTSIEASDPLTGAHGGLRNGSLRVQYATALPKVFYVDGGYEYWGRAASLTHTTPDGSADVGFLPSERRYVMASAQHSSPATFPPPGTQLSTPPSVDIHRGDPLDQRLILRALLVNLVAWVKDGRTPPPSQYPTIASRTLVSAESVKFPRIAGMTLTPTPYQPYRTDLQWQQSGIVAVPPRLGAPYRVLVPAVDSLGNDASGIRAVELRVPLATYFPWQMRTGLASPTHLVSFQGTFIPLSVTDSARAARGDSRPSIGRLYPSRAAFLAKVDAASRALVEQRFMLPEDVPRARARMAATWDWIVH